MTDELTPVRCGCGGEPELEPRRSRAMYMCYALRCPCCGIEIRRKTESEAITAWNRAMGERTAKVIEHDASVTDTDGYKYHRTEYLCDDCKKRVLGGDDYCSHCGCRLDWDEDIPMEYFESGGI